MISKSITNDCLFWNVSNEVLVRIEEDSYWIPKDEPSAKKPDAHTWAHTQQPHYNCLFSYILVKYKY